MKVSFLVTYYNQCQYVKKSLDSILAIKKDFEWEILVGDDGSTDGTIDVVKDYVEKHPKNIFLNIMPREAGKKYSSVKRASANRLALLERMTGDAFCILDGDDWFCDYTFVNDAVKVFDANEEVSIVAFGFKYVRNDIDGKQIVLPDKFNNSIVETSIYLRRFYIHAGACVYRKSFAKNRIEYIKGIGFFDDNDIVINSLNYGNMFYIKKVVYAYRQTGVSVYTSMDRLEQAILNVQGYDVDLKLIDEEHVEALQKRYASHIILTYLCKNDLETRIGTEKYNRYLEECKCIDESLTYKLLKYNDISNVDRLMCDYIFSEVVKANKKTFVKMFLKYIKMRAKSLMH